MPSTWRRRVLLASVFGVSVALSALIIIRAGPDPAKTSPDSKQIRVAQASKNAAAPRN